MRRILITGAIGFIGYNLTKKLISEDHTVIGIDNINGYYNVKQKYDKLPLLGIEEIVHGQTNYCKARNTTIINWAKLTLPIGFKLKNYSGERNLIQ